MKAAILENLGEPLRIRELDMPSDLEDGQVLVRMTHAGICGAQLQEIDGEKGDPSHCPHLLGHEGCGILFGRAEKAVIHWRKGDGKEGRLYRFGEIGAGPCTTFSEYTVVSENRVTVIPDDVPNDFAALLGCCLSTALALVENEADVENTQTAFVIGCGGLGLALILALKAAGVPNVLAHDIHERKKTIVEDIGAKFLFNQAAGFDLVIDTTGQYQHLATGRYISLQKGGSEGGGFNPTRDIPRYVQMWRDGKLNGWEKIITHRIKLDEINKGIALMRQGKAGRVMIEFDHGCLHVPRCFENNDSCWNYDESKKRAMAFPNFP